MIASLTSILKDAEKRHIAIGSFNGPNLESTRAIIAAAEKLRLPVILMHAQIHEEMGFLPIEEAAPMLLFYAKRASVPVAVHLDHATDLDYVDKALKLGFTSVMFDGSLLPEKDNFEQTRTAVKMARACGSEVEGEIGSLASREGGGGGGESVYTEPDDAERFVRETGIDVLACAFGTAHGIYLKKPQLDFPRLAEIRSRVSVPLVMHGGSGVSPEDYRKVIDIGVSKINYYTYMAKAGAAGVMALEDKLLFQDMAVAAEKAMETDVEKAMRVFAGID